MHIAKKLFIFCVKFLIVSYIKILSFLFNMEKVLFAYVEKSSNYERLQLGSRMAQAMG